MRRGIALVLAAATVLTAAACGGEDRGRPGTGGIASAPADRIAGNVTVLTNRTDQIADGTLKRYAEAFHRAYPKATVTFEGITDYEGEVSGRLRTGSYGDVLPIPNNLPLGDYPTYFAPLGDTDLLGQTFDFTEYGTVGRQVYGLANIGIATGFVYNKAVFRQAGIEDWPTTPKEFLDDMRAVKAKTRAVPYYTNYADGWPLRQWSDAIGVVGCDNTARDTLATTAAPWGPGAELSTIDGLLYAVVHQQLSEDDPAGTDWEQSKSLLGGGRIGAMYLGSWAVPQLQAAARAVGQNPDDIGFMPFPAQREGHFCTVVQPDYRYGVSLHAKNRDAALAWLDWYLTQSGSARGEQAISAVRGAPLPPALKLLDQRGVRMIPQTRRNSLAVGRIDKAAGIGLDAPDYRRRLVDAARRSATGDPGPYFAELNRAWAPAQRANAPANR
ncbi:ABC transporter substrate-binding protein [Kitasatospora terrestris]|uniref:Extracellular solute-binding protein n=1 Tax=Kitasatospora terrestris TaxID=258051 RepID=A0ABP9ER54_9ACTN